MLTRLAFICGLVFFWHQALFAQNEDAAAAITVDSEFIQLLSGKSERAKMNELSLYFDSLESKLAETKGLPAAIELQELQLDSDLPFKVKNEIERVYEIYARYRTESPDSKWFRETRIPDQLGRLRLELQTAQSDLPPGVCRPSQPGSLLDDLPEIFREANEEDRLQESVYQKVAGDRPENWSPQRAAEFARELHEAGNFSDNVPVISRKQSGLKPPRSDINRWPGGPNGEALPLTEIVFHHTATGEIVFPDAPKVIQEMHFVRSMSDVGYHFLIDREGNIYEGRSLQNAGGHAGVNAVNNRSIGIAFVTNSSAFDPVNNASGFTETKMAAPSPAAAQAALSLIATLQNPNSDLVRGAEGPGRIKLAIKTASGHRHHKSTICPGEGCLDLLNVLEEITEERED